MIDLQADARFTYWRAFVAGVELPTLAERLAALRPPWMDQGECRGNGTRAYFPDRGVGVARAKAVCAACAVRGECLAYAIADPACRACGAVPAKKKRARYDGPHEPA